MIKNFYILELLKNSLVPINKTALIARFHKIETDGELIFQQLYFKKNKYVPQESKKLNFRIF
ncbi:hypothetical protein DV30_18990 [Leptospira interrogans serovar Canicola str. Gui44]|nr:hypothetical protein IQ65_03805 [Leptospira interrogans serovar Lai]OQM27804.1 hypothetical protein DV30_18990 [Leptospira interrogans serovar Canicola str. Gui44]OQM28725.1 hypothetical protein DV38_14670 [Leptospira interrogans]